MYNEIRYIGSLKIQRVDKNRYYVIDFKNKSVTGYYSKVWVDALIVMQKM